MTFPAADVSRILNIVQPTKGDTYVRRNFTLAELGELEVAGALNLDEQQNDSPSIGEFLTFFRLDADRYRDLVFFGYIIFPPRNDARVSVEGFECRPTANVDAEVLRQTFGHADEFEYKNGVCSAWWD